MHPPRAEHQTSREAPPESIVPLTPEPAHRGPQGQMPGECLSQLMPGEPSTDHVPSGAPPPTEAQGHRGARQGEPSVFQTLIMKSF